MQQFVIYDFNSLSLSKSAIHVFLITTMSIYYQIKFLVTNFDLFL